MKQMKTMIASIAISAASVFFAEFSGVVISRAEELGMSVWQEAALESAFGLSIFAAVFAGVVFITLFAVNVADQIL